jgi:hypothetical protein
MTHPSIELPKFDRRHRSSYQHRADHHLARHAYRVELVGTLGALDWPAVCANCGFDTEERLTVKKVFARPRALRRTSRGYTRYIIAAADVPYCPECAAKHRALVPHRSLLGDAWRMLWPVLIPMAGSGWFFLLTLRIALQEQSRGDLAAKYVWALPALFAFILGWCVVIAWWSSRSLRVERQTDVTRACDFSDDVSRIWERERRIYALREERFARAFADANADRVWAEADDRRSSRILTASMAVAGVAAVVVWLVVVFAPL